jgi:hypothetical protein
MTLFVGIGSVMYALNNPDPQTHSLMFCKLRGWTFQIFLMLSRWFIAFACIDRYALTSDDVRLRNLANKKTAYRAIAALTLVWAIICSHRMIYYNIDGNLCAIINNMGASLYHSIYVIVGGGVLPATIMIVCACLIRRNLVHKQQRRAQISTNRQRSLDQQVLNVLLIQVVCYIIFTIPQLCNLVFNTISITLPNRSSEHLMVERFATFIAELMLYLFPVTSFYLYTLTSRTFRLELLKSFRPLFGRCCKVQVVPTIDGSVTHYHRQHHVTAAVHP